ncbi:MAG: hypothetical protein NTV86_06625 [Planctomycetota bacterium]|nr:hypothetical protein [Planctomycetota bacterium]
MARKDSSKSSGKDAKNRPHPLWERLSEPLRRALRRTVGWTLATLLLAGGIALGFQAVEKHVLGHATSTHPIGVEVRCVVTAPWSFDPAVRVPEKLIRRVESALTPERLGFYDAGLVDAVHSLALANPWVRTVTRVQRLPVDARGISVVQVDCSLRAPLARVLARRPRADEPTTGDEPAVAYVDAEGVRLPDADVPRYALTGTGPGGQEQLTFIDEQDAPEATIPHLERIHYVGLRGLAKLPPAFGRVWEGPDVAEALRAVQLLYTRPYGRSDLDAVDVSNFTNRDPANAEIVLLARRDDRRPTAIQFGRFPHPRADWVIRPERKLAWLDQYARTEGAGHICGVRKSLDLTIEGGREGEAYKDQ